jgi:hypothetical protein
MVAPFSLLAVVSSNLYTLFPYRTGSGRVCKGIPAAGSAPIYRYTRQKLAVLGTKTDTVLLVPGSFFWQHLEHTCATGVT